MTDLTSPPARASSLTTMRLAASGLLVIMAGLFVLALRQTGPGWDYVRAFAEAAMVGGLADWFAVTAIFRRPLGLPIPHTGVIPRNKERIADALGAFVSVNFLAPDVVTARLAHQDLARGLGRTLADAATAQRIADGLVDAAPSLLGLLDDQTVGDFLRRRVAAMTGDERLTMMLGRALRILTDQGRHQALLDAAIAEGWRALEQNEGAIRAQVRARTSWAYRLIALDARAADALIAAIDSLLRDMSRDPDHPARARVTALLQRMAEDVQTDPALRAQIERVAADILAHPSVGSYFSDVWRALKSALTAAAEDRAAPVRAAIADAIAGLGRAMLDDEEVIDAVNRRLRAFAAEVAGRHGDDFGRLISETIRSWDTDTVVAKLEQNVGADLQYIRINGALIGGVIGLAIHQASLLLAP